MTTGFNLQAALQRRRRGSPSSVGKIEPAIVGKDWKKHKKLDTRLLPVHRYTEAQTVPGSHPMDHYYLKMIVNGREVTINERTLENTIEKAKAAGGEVTEYGWICGYGCGQLHSLTKADVKALYAGLDWGDPGYVPKSHFKFTASTDYKPGDLVDVRMTLMSGGPARPNYRSWVRGYKFVRRDSPGVPFTGTMNPHNPDGAPQGHIIVRGPVVGGEGEVRYDENDVRPAQMRAVKVWFSDGNHLVTNMAKGITDKEIRDYYAVGRTFNVGQDPDGQEDNLVKVTRIEILD